MKTDGSSGAAASNSRGAAEDAASDGAFPGPSVAELEELVGFELRRAQAASARKFTELFSDLNIRPGQLSILIAVSREPDQTQAKLSRALSLDPSSLVPLLDQLQAKGYISRAARDKRSHALRITTAGREALERSEGRIQGHEQALLAGIGAKDRETLLRLLKRVRKNLED